MKRTLGLLVVSLVALPACGPPAVVQAVPNAAAMNEPVRHESAVASGTVLHAQLLQPMDTRGSRVGDGFEAVLTDTLRDPSGRVIASPGARIGGHIAALMHGRLPLIVLAFDTIDTSDGLAPLSVRVVRAEHVMYRGPERIAQPPAGPAFSTAIFEPTTELLAFSDVYGPPNGGYAVPLYVGHPREDHMDRGAELVLQLTAPLTAH